MSKPKSPPPPDYAAAAKEQGTQNINAALATNFLNQANQVGPMGSQTYAYDYNNGYRLPDGTIIPHATVTTQLNPDQQQLLDQQTGISKQLNDLAAKGIGYVGQAADMPPIPGGLTPLSQGLARTNFDADADPTQNQIAGSYDFSNVTAMPNRNEFNQSRDQVTSAYMERLQPYIDRDRQALQSKLANQGITLGSEAYGADNDVFNRGVNDQRIAALLAGDQEAQRLFGNAMQMRGQGVSEAMAQGNFGNQAQAQEYGQNQQALQNYNAAAQANFGQGLAASQFANQARAQAIQEADYARNAPLNMLNALRTGNQATMPQFGNVMGGATIAPAPVYNAAQDQYAAAMQQYQNKLQAQNGLMQGIAGIGTAGIMAASDRRLKTNIKFLGVWFKCLPLYVYNYIWGGGKRIGVMADDVAKLRPEALGPSIGGFMTVNYGVLRNGN